MINAIYLFVAILMFIVWVMNINPGEKHLKSVKRFHFIMQIIFFILNVICLILVRENEFFKYSVIRNSLTGEKIISIGYILFGIPIIMYIIDFIIFLIKKDHYSNSLLIIIPWAIYVMLLFCECYPVCIKSENVIQEKEKLVSYQEEIVKSSFFNNSVYGIDYVIKKQNSSGGEEDEIIQTKKYKDTEKVELYLHQENSYIEKYCAVKTNITFWGTKYERIEEEETTYKIYLTDELYEKSK